MARADGPAPGGPRRAEALDEAGAWLAAHWDPELTLRAWWGLLADAGYAFPTWPAGMGGRGWSAGESRAVSRLIAERGAVGPPGGVGQMLGGPVLAEYGDDEQRARWILRLAAGLESWCQLYSEPNAGSDLAAVETRAVRDGDAWVVNGQKVWTREAAGADRGLLLARTDPTVPKHRGLTFFVVDLDQPGVDVRPIRQMNGRTTFFETFLTDVVVPTGRVLGEVGGGWAVASATLAFERAEVSGRGPVVPTRVAEPGERNGALDRPVGALVAEHAEAERRRRAVAGIRKPPAAIALAREMGRADDPLVRQELAAFHAFAETARFNGLRARGAATQGRRPGPEASTGKLAGSEMGRRAQHIALAVQGAYGMLVDDDAPHGGAFQQMALSVPSLSIAGGTDEIQRNVVAERILGLPREPQVDRDVPFNEVRRGREAR